MSIKASEAARFGEWQPIETAPQGETPVLVYADDEVTLGWRMGGKGRWIDAFSDTMHPTHWMPLPPPPAEQ